MAVVVLFSASSSTTVWFVILFSSPLSLPPPIINFQKPHDYIAKRNTLPLIERKYTAPKIIPSAANVATKLFLWKVLFGPLNILRFILFFVYKLLLARTMVYGFISEIA